MGSTVCIKCGSSLAPFSNCELCNEPLNFKCASCGFVTEVKVHVDCANANSLTKEDRSTTEKGPVSNTTEKAEMISTENPDAVVSNKAAQTDNVNTVGKVTNTDRDVYHFENYPWYTFSIFAGKSMHTLAEFSLDMMSLSNKLLSTYFEQCLQYEKAWSHYWIETFNSSQRRQST